MKKMYMKPQATNVAFVVNENIAVSKKSWDGKITLLQSYEGCADVYEANGMIFGKVNDGVTYNYLSAWTDLDENHHDLVSSWLAAAVAANN